MLEEDLCTEENLVGLVVAFYERGANKPSEYYFLGHVTKVTSFRYDESEIRNPIQVTSLDGKEYRYFGLTNGEVWRTLLYDPFKDTLVIYGKGPALFFDIVP